MPFSGEILNAIWSAWYHRSGIERFVKNSDIRSLLGDIDKIIANSKIPDPNNIRNLLILSNKISISEMDFPLAVNGTIHHLVPYSVELSVAIKEAISVDPTIHRSPKKIPPSQPPRDHHKSNVPSFSNAMKSSHDFRSLHDGRSSFDSKSFQSSNLDSVSHNNQNLQNSNSFARPNSDQYYISMEYIKAPFDSEEAALIIQDLKTPLNSFSIKFWTNRLMNNLFPGVAFHHPNFRNLEKLIMTKMLLWPIEIQRSTHIFASSKSATSRAEVEGMDFSQIQTVQLPEWTVRREKVVKRKLETKSLPSFTRRSRLRSQSPPVKIKSVRKQPIFFSCTFFLWFLFTWLFLFCVGFVCYVFCFFFLL